jgi:prevent-host-death family protein
VDWHLQDAKNNFSKVVRLARSEGPQTVTLRGERAAVVLSIDEYERLIAKTPSLGEFLLSGPVWDDELVEEVNRRNTSTARNIDV